MELKNILVTGGCGFLGQYLIKDLLSSFPKADIRVLDLRENKYNLFDHEKNSRVKVLLGKDITDYDSIKNDFKDIDCVIHLAGIVSFSLKDEDLLKKVNVEGTKNVLKAASSNKVKKFLHISSVAALGYNDDKNKPINEKFKFNWEIAEKKKKYYMLTKHLADIVIEKSYDKSDMDIVVLYPGLMFGPGDVTNSAKLINAIKDKKIPFNMPGGTNIVDVRDVSKGIISAVKNGKKKEDYLLSGHNLTFKTVNNTIANELDVKAPKLVLPRCLNGILFKILLVVENKAKNKLQLTADNLDSAFKYRYFSNKKAEQNLKWSPKITFERTIKDTIKWMDKDGLFKR